MFGASYDVLHVYLVQIYYRTKVRNKLGIREKEVQKFANMVDKQGQPFNAYVRMDKEQNRPRFYKWNPDKSQKSGKVEAVAEEHKTQVAVNNHGKTNEATKNVKEPLKTGQTQPTAEQKQDENKQKKSRGRKM